MVMIMLKMNKMNKTSKLLNSLALVAALTVSTAVCAMEPEDPKVTVTKQSPVVVNEDLMKIARLITRLEVLKNLRGHSRCYFRVNPNMLWYDSLDTSKKVPMKLNKLQYDRNIHYFNETFLSNPDCETTLNKDIIAFLEYGKNPAYLNYEDAFYGVAPALSKVGITLEALVGKTDDAKVLREESTPSEAVRMERSASSEALEGKTDAVKKVVKEESSSSEALEDNKSHKRRHCIIS